MTDRNPDDLYDALRDRLGDYGQEPPAALWAGIRAKLPPSVAAPQLRKRRRVPVAWLFFITMTMVAVGGAWHWWGPKSTNTVSKAGSTDTGISFPNATRTNAATTPSPNAASSTNSPAALNQPLATQTPPTTTQQASADAASGPVDNSAAATAASADAAGAGATPDAATAAAPAASVTKAPAGAVAAGPAKAAAVAAAGHTAPDGIAGCMARRGMHPTAKELAANNDPGNNASVRNAREQVRGLGKPPRTVASASRWVPKTANPAAARPSVAHSGSRASKAAGTLSSQDLAASQKPLTQPGRRAEKALAAAAKPAARQPRPPAGAAQTTDQPAIQPAATTAETITAQPAAGRSNSRPALDILTARLVAVQLAAGLGLPAPQPVAVVPSPLPLPFASRWAVQVVAGPVLTYRTLSTAGAGSSTSPTLLPTNSTTSPVATLERPALGSAAQVAVRRTLGGHWSLSAGLGYAEYASALALQQVHAATGRLVPNTPDSASATGIHRRDTYRFVTVPVRVGYGWTLSGRWRVGVLAGAEAAMYVGGSSTEGSTCACQSQTWGFSGSPYRRVSAGASLGAEARYRLAGGRWELLAQPTATYLLTPLAPANSAYYQRHLFGGAALLGVAFNLP
jgi:hypothetical protein